MRSISAAVCAVVVMLAGGAARSEEPIKSGDVVSGKLRLVKTRHPNGTPMEAYQVVSTPRQMPAGDNFCTNPGGKATTFHLFSKTKEDGATLSRLIGKKVRIRVWELFCSQTAWHVGDVAVAKWSW